MRKKAQRSRMAFRISTGEYILFTISLVCVTSLVSLISYISFTESKEVLMFYMRSTVFLCIAVVIIVVLLFAVAVNSIRKQQVQKEMVDILERQAHINIEDIDLCSAVSNILENAVEACRECKDKRIDMHAAVHNENLIIQISNTYKEKQIDNSKTSKSDSEFHGYGIKSVMHIIRKYDGSINCFEGDGMYHVMIQFNEKAKR